MKISRRDEKNKQQEDRITQAVTLAVLEAVPEAMRAHRKIDLDRPMELELRPVIELRDEAIKHGLRKILDSNSFFISDFKSLCDVASVYPPANLLQILQPLHCVSWVDMDHDFRHQIQQQIIACFVPVETQEQGTVK